MPTYRYSRWDGTQQVFGLDEDSLLEALSEDVLAHGDLDRALRNLFQRGLQGEEGQRIEGLRDLIDRLKKQRQLQLERHNLDSLMDDLKERLEDVVDTERRAIDKRLDEARKRIEQAGETQQDFAAPMRLLEQRAEKSTEALDDLPESPAGAIKELSEYDFMDDEARRKFQELLDTLSQQMAENLFESMRDQLRNMSPEDLEALRNMVGALNQMLSDREMALDPDFDGFMEQYGNFFDPDRPTSLDELLDRIRSQMAAMQSVANSMPPEMRAELESLMESAIDPGLAQELAELAAQMQGLFPTEDLAQDYPFLGDDPVTLDQAMEALGRVQEMDELERELREIMFKGGIEDVDPERVEELAGEEARQQLEALQRVVKQLEEAGYLKREGDRLELTARAIRKLGQQALREVFAQLKKDRIGGHEVYARGDGGELTGETKAYEFGDPFDIDLQRTVFNGVLRGGPGLPVQLTPEDLEVNRTEHLTQSATVLLLDQSRSMGMFGSWGAAKKVALALYWLIHTQFRRDYFHVIGFSDYAIDIDQEHLAEVTWNDWVSGTNMHHAFMLSRKLLAKQRAASKQILMITDGEPTAHLEGGYAYFNYPPTYRTIDETLKEVKRCTQAGITINTFMLATNHYLVNFIDMMTQINRGRAFYTTPRELGRYVMVDYLRARRKRMG